MQQNDNPTIADMEMAPQTADPPISPGQQRHRVRKVPLAITSGMINFAGVRRERIVSRRRPQGVLRSIR
jgi:hypothetical protein